jgi:hypothetical protein
MLVVFMLGLDPVEVRDAEPFATVKIRNRRARVKPPRELSMIRGTRSRRCFNRRPVSLARNTGETPVPRAFQTAGRRVASLTEIQVTFSRETIHHAIDFVCSVAVFAVWNHFVD